MPLIWSLRANIILAAILSSLAAQEDKRCVEEPTIAVTEYCRNATTDEELSFSVTCSSTLSCNESFSVEWITPNNETRKFNITTTIDEDSLVSTLTVENASLVDDLGFYGCYIEDGEVVRGAEESIAFDCSEKEAELGAPLTNADDRSYTFEVEDDSERLDGSDDIHWSEKVSEEGRIPHELEIDPETTTEGSDTHEAELAIDSEKISEEGSSTQKPENYLEELSEEGSDTPKIEKDSVMISDDVTTVLELKIESENISEEGSSTQEPENYLEELSEVGSGTPKIDNGSAILSDVTTVLELKIDSENISEEGSSTQEPENELEELSEVGSSTPKIENDSKIISEVVHKLEIDLEHISEEGTSTQKPESDLEELSEEGSDTQKIETASEIISEDVTSVYELEIDSEIVAGEGMVSHKPEMFSEKLIDVGQSANKLVIDSETIFHDKAIEEDFIWQLSIHSPTPNMTYAFYKEPQKEPLDLSNSKYSVTWDPDAGHLIFTIKDLTLDDYGNYHVELQSKDLKANSTILLFVKAPPKVHDTYLALETKPGKLVTVSADILALDYQHFDLNAKRHLAFEWKYRKDDLCWGMRDAEKLRNFTDTFSGSYDEEIMSTVTFEARESGYIILIVKNEFGESCASILTIDVEIITNSAQYGIISAVIIAIGLFVGIHLFRSGRKKRAGFELVKEEEMHEFKNHSPLV